MIKTTLSLLVHIATVRDEDICETMRCEMFVHHPGVSRSPRFTAQSLPLLMSTGLPVILLDIRRTFTSHCLVSAFSFSGKYLLKSHHTHRRCPNPLSIYLNCKLILTHYTGTVHCSTANREHSYNTYSFLINDKL